MYEEHNDDFINDGDEYKIPSIQSSSIINFNVANVRETNIITIEDQTEEDISDDEKSVNVGINGYSHFF